MNSVQKITPALPKENNWFGNQMTIFISAVMIIYPVMKEAAPFGYITCPSNNGSVFNDLSNHPVMEKKEFTAVQIHPAEGRTA